MEQQPLPWTLRLKSWQLFLLFVFFHPVYGLWLYHMGTYCATGVKRKTVFFRIICGYIMLVYLLLQLPIISWLVSGHTHMRSIVKNDQIFISILVISWWLCLAIAVIKAANYVLAFQSKDNKEKTTYNLSNVITWSMLIGYWIIGVWFMQAMMNDLGEED
jgi:hypothetical protein